MRIALLRAGALAGALLASACFSAPAMGQTGQTAPPEMRSVDANGVDLISGDYAFSFTEAAIGAGEGALALTRTGTNGPGANGWQNMWLEQNVAGSTVTVNVVLGDHTETFTRSGTSAFAPELGNGATLTGNAGTAYVYLGPEGTTITFGTPAEDPLGNSAFCSHQNSDAGGCTALALSLVRPNGARLDFTWDVRAHCVLPDPEAGGRDCDYAWRLSRVDNNFGYRIAFGYISDSYSFPGGTPDFFVQNAAVLSNTNVSGSTLLNVSYARPSAGVLDVTVPAPSSSETLTWRFTSGSGSFAIRRPGSSSDNVTVAYGSSGVTSVTRDGLLTGYARSVFGNNATTTITQDDGDDTTANPVTIAVANLAKGRLVSVTDPLNHSTTWSYDSSNRLAQVTQPEGNSAAYTYDARGNVTRVRQREKGETGDTDDDIVTEADYLSTCSNVVTCNLPTATRDALGRQTDYTYDSTHGGVLTVTAPAPASGATRPQTRFAYSQVTAVTGQPVYQLTQISACAAGSTASPTCVGTADESRTVIGYDSVNVRPTSVETRNGLTSPTTGALSATTAFAYNSYGDVTSVDGPLTGSADTIVLRYDGARRRIGAVSPDPDGDGGLPHRAVRTTFRADGQVSKVEQGTVASQSDSAWASFATLAETQAEFDSNNRPVLQRLVSDGTAYALTQTGYDGFGRVRCVAQRMNQGEFATSSLPSDVCALDTEGSDGPDRISRNSYDAAGRVTRVEAGVGVTGVVADEVTTAYTDNGQVETVTDANGNKTTYEYDGFDRLRNTRYPLPATAGTSAPTSGTGADFEQLSYDAASNLVSRRTRAGQTIAYTYDALNRLTGRDLPSGAWYDIDRTYSYDNLGRLTLAGGNGDIGFSYDALGRLTAEAHPLGTTGYEYDVAGRRTRLTWPGGFYVVYDYDFAGEVVAIRENGGTATPCSGSGGCVLASYTYDDRGRRTRVDRGNGTATTYDYDAVDRLTGLTQDLSGTANDLTLDFGYNPAGQIASNTRSNNAYAWTDHYAINRAYTANGLNQYTASGSVNPTYSTNGNLVSDGTRGFEYNAENRLTVGYIGAAHQELIDDSLDRLSRYYDGTANRWLTYDGQSLIAEWNAAGTAIARRYVHGPGTDEPLVWYEGSGTSDRRWLHADERGSIVATSDGSGAMLTINTYDEYGIPGAGNAGRFQYTGQMRLNELGLYYYRARLYSPSLGRFMQTDPIGFGGGMNLYAYVLNDPVNSRDPTGLACDRPEEMITVCGSRFLSHNSGGSFFPVNLMLTSNTRINEDEALACRADPEHCATSTGHRTSAGAPPPLPFLPPSVQFVAASTHGDYCGSADHPGVPDILPGVNLRGACARHDRCYSTLGATKAFCDQQFRRDVFIACITSVGAPLYCSTMAEGYYLGVYLGGQGPYDAAQRTARARRGS